jgi:dihydropteroate synthase
MRAEQRARRDTLLHAIGTRPVIMGILNVTPDTFSDGGLFLAAEVAVRHAERMLGEGCDIVDVGGESTRPGADAVSEEEELARIEPVLTKLVERGVAPVSVDTYKATVARRAVALGAILINDVWGLQRDPRMAEAVADTEAGVVIMHNRLEKDESIDIFSDLRRFFDRSLALAGSAGIPTPRMVLDPGVGFGKTSRQNREALRRIPDLIAIYRLPILIGVSRKKFLGSMGEGAEGSLAGTIAANLAAAMCGAAIFRVHDVVEHVAALRVLQTIRRPD